MAVHPDLCRTWSETPKTGFVVTPPLKLYYISGMFESVNGTEHAITAGNSHSDRNDRKPMKQDRKDFPGGVVGIGVNKQGSLDDPNMDILDDIDDVRFLL